MKIYATSDLHGNLEGLDPIGQDIVVIAGDFAIMKGWSKWHLNDQKKWTMKKFIPWTQKYPTTQFVIVPGNHDLFMDSKFINQHDDIDLSIQWPDNVHLLIDKQIEVNGLKIYGTPWIPVISHKWAFEADEEKQALMYSKIPENLDILVTHSPPSIPASFIDRSLQYGISPSFGSSILADSILLKKPKHVFCGHIHTGDHAMFKLNGIKIYNVSRLNEDYEIAYEPTLVGDEQ